MLYVALQRARCMLGPLSDDLYHRLRTANRLPFKLLPHHSAWGRETCSGFLRFDDRNHPEGTAWPDLERTLAEMLADAVWHGVKGGKPIAAAGQRSGRTRDRPAGTRSRDELLEQITLRLSSSWTSPGSLLEGLLALVEPASGPQVPAAPLASIVAPELATPSGVPLDEDHRARLDEIQRLCRGAARQHVVVAGQSSAGKKPILATLLAACEGYPTRPMLRLEDGTMLPILAVACKSFGTARLVDLVFAWLVLRVPSFEEAQRVELGGVDQTTKLELIARALRERPVLVLLADLHSAGSTPVEQIVRGANVWPLLERMVQEGAQARLLVSWSLPDDSRNHGLDGPLKGAAKVRIDRTAAGGLKELFGSRLNNTMRLWVQQAADAGRRIDGVIIVVGSTLLDLFDRQPARRGVHQAELQQSLFEPWRQVLPKLVATLDRLLDAEERAALVLLAASADGLRPATFARLYPLLQEAPPETGSQDLEDWATTLLGERLATMVQLAPQRLDPRTAPPGQARPEPTFELEDAIRHQLLAHWLAGPSAPLLRRAFWLVAREAMAQARNERLLAPVTDLPSLSREIMAYQALLASIDLAEPGEERPIGLSPGEAILPPIARRQAPMPTGRMALRFAWHELYRRDLDGDGRGRLLIERDEPLLQLDLLLRLFAPDRVFEPARQRRLADTTPGHLLLAFTPGEILAMLAVIAAAAVRVRRIDLVAAVNRQAEQLVELAQRAGEPLPLLELLPVWLAEIDLASQLGGQVWPEPDAIPVAALELVLADPAERAAFLALPGPARGVDAGGQVHPHHLLWVVARVGERLRAACGVAPAEARLLARAAEALRLLGASQVALAVFARAGELERLHRGQSRPFAIGNPILDMTDLDRWARLLLEAAGNDDAAPAADPLARPPLTAGAPPLEQALALIDRNLRRLTAWRDRDGRLLQLVTQARLAELQGEFARAQELLDMVECDLPNAGASLGAHLDQATVKARLGLRVLVRQGASLATEDWRAWRRRADAAIKRLRDLALAVPAGEHDLPPLFKPHRCYAAILAARLHLLRAARGKGKLAHLTEAATLIEDAELLMQECGYELRRAELSAAREQLARLISAAGPPVAA